jgi:hypothetical protein
MKSNLQDAIVIVLLDVVDGQASTFWVTDQILARGLYRARIEREVLAIQVRSCARNPKYAHLFQTPTRNTIKLRIETPVLTA